MGGGKRLAEARALVERDRLANVQFHPYQPRDRLGTSLAVGVRAVVERMAVEAGGKLLDDLST